MITIPQRDEIKRLSLDIEHAATEYVKHDIQLFNCATNLDNKRRVLETYLSSLIVEGKK